MTVGTITIKGQIVIPASIRKRLGLTQGTRVCFLEREGEVAIRPLTKAYFEQMAGLLRGGRSLSKTLLKERRRDRRREDRK